MNKKDKIIVENVTKKFKIGFKKNQSFLARIGNFFSGKEPKKTFIAVKDVSFSVKEGEVLGIIGSNGSGKSTLLRILAGIYSSDGGKVIKKGSVLPVIGLGTGMQSRLTMKDNVFLVGSLFGLGRGVIKERFDSIVEFAELSKFINTKLYQFSAGMLQRLAFSIVIHCDPDILLLDEVFEVGDEKFRKKSSKKMKEILKSGKTIIMVTHSLDDAKKRCKKVIWMDKGEMKMVGPAKRVVKAYEKANK